MNRIEELQKRFYEEPCVAAIGMDLVIMNEGFVIVSMTINERVTMKEGFANGGFLAMLGNTAGVYAAMSKIPHGHTRMMSIGMHPVSPAMAGEYIIGSARVIQEGKQHIWVTFEIKNGNTRQLKAFGSAQYIKPKNDALS